MKIFVLLFSLFVYSYCVDVPVDAQVPQEAKQNIAVVEKNKIEIFGKNLFNGEFSKFSQHRYNPEYILNIGDTINLKLWGAVEVEIKLTIDEQGNIFVPKVGTVRLLGVKNKDLSSAIDRVLKSTYKDNVYVYANLDNFQPVSIFVTGGVVKPGLYEGLSSDSILQFLDKSKGIERGGSYRYISIIRDNRTLLTVDLYEYLINGKLDVFQFKTGDMINVSYLNGFVTVEGDIQKPLQIEMKESLTLDTIIKLTQPNIEATDIVISRYNAQNEKILLMSPLTNKNIKIEANDNIKFVSNNNNTNIEIKIDGEHQGLRNIIVKKGTTLKDIISQITYSPLSSAENINLFRKSTAELQKQLLDSSLNELESSVLKTGSTTTDEAIIRKQEASLVLDFIKRAREVEPKGRVILNKNTDFSKVILEADDIIYVPRVNHIVTVQGEVKIPSALTYVEDMDFEEYVALCGGLNVRADENNMLIIHPNGNVSTYESGAFTSSSKIQPGDSILVVGKIDTKNLQIFKDMTQILYQIAVGAGVVIKLL